MGAIPGVLWSFCRDERVRCVGAYRRLDEAVWLHRRKRRAACPGVGKLARPLTVLAGNLPHQDPSAVSSTLRPELSKSRSSVGLTGPGDNSDSAIQQCRAFCGFLEPEL